MIAANVSPVDGSSLRKIVPSPNATSSNRVPINGDFSSSPTSPWIFFLSASQAAIIPAATLIVWFDPPANGESGRLESPYSKRTRSTSSPSWSASA